MAEEQDKKEKPKATLIKHRKPKEPEKTTSEKKKVVVIKKKTAPKKTVHKVVAKKEPAAETETKKTSASFKSSLDKLCLASPFSKESKASTLLEYNNKLPFIL